MIPNEELPFRHTGRVRVNEGMAHELLATIQTAISQTRDKLDGYRDADVIDTWLVQQEKGRLKRLRAIKKNLVGTMLEKGWIDNYEEEQG